ncbi:MAG TPA: DUF58 domain-containing protein [Pirellulales bacterium]
MAASILSRYLDPDALSRMMQQRLEPRGLVIGNLAGAHRSPLHGFAVEFAGHREYTPGDDPKHIDWRVYFTREKYFIKQYEMETNYVCHLILDVSASMRYGHERSQKLLYAAQMVTTLAYSIAKASDKVSFTAFDDEIVGAVPPGASMGQIEKITERLDEIKPVKKTKMAECLTELVGRMRRREIVMIFSDFFTDLEALENALQLMRFSKHEVVLFHVLHHDELTFTFEGMVKFVGLEEAGEYVAQSEDVKRGYLEAFQKYREQLEEVCHRNHVERVEVDTSRDMGELFVNYLNSRSFTTAGR